MLKDKLAKMAQREREEAREEMTKAMIRERQRARQDAAKTKQLVLTHTHTQLSLHNIYFQLAM